MKKILPIQMPPITTFPAIANLFAILWTQEKRVLPWVADHYIQLVVKNAEFGTDSDWANFYDNSGNDDIDPRAIIPFLSYQWMDRKCKLRDFNVFTDFVEIQIDNGHYIEVSLNRKYLSCSPEFSKTDFIHATFIYGYDRKKDEIYIADFYAGKYELKCVSYKEICQSYANGDYSVHAPDWFTTISTYKFKDVNYETNFELLKLTLEDYLNCEDRRCKFRYDILPTSRQIECGISYYDSLKNYYQKVQDKFSRLGTNVLLNLQSEIYDVRPFSILKDHKNIMKIRLAYLSETNVLKLEEYENLVEQCDTLLHQTSLLMRKIIKHNMTRKMDESGISKLIDTLKASDKRLFTDLLMAIEGKKSIDI